MSGFNYILTGLTVLLYIDKHLYQPFEDAEQFKYDARTLFLNLNFILALLEKNIIEALFSVATAYFVLPLP